MPSSINEYQTRQNNKVTWVYLDWTNNLRIAQHISQGAVDDCFIYQTAVLNRYRRANGEEKGKILDEFVKVTGYRRKADIRRLTVNAKPAAGHRGRPTQYHSTLPSLKAIWEASNQLCSKRLQSFLPELIKVPRRNKELPLDANTEARLIKMSPATTDRLLEPYRQAGGRISPGIT